MSGRRWLCCARPSGTEPKIKFYFEARAKLAGVGDSIDSGTVQYIFISLFSLAREEGYAFSLMRDLVPSSSGYLPSGWYGRDAASGSLGSFNELFCRNETYRYYLGRYLALSAFVDESKKDRVLRRRLQEMLAVLPSGSLFICDTHSACLSLAEHRQFYKTILEAEKSLEENKLMQTRSSFLSLFLI